MIAPIGIFHSRIQRATDGKTTPWTMKLFLFQSEGVNISRSHVANQHRRVFRIEAEPASCRPRGVESLQIDNALLDAV